MNRKDIKDISDVLDDQEWMTPLAEGVQGAVESTYKAGGTTGQTIKNFLHGKFLGHPLHPVLTDIPIGAWTMALAFDALDAVRGKRDLSKAADTAVGIGLVGAVGAAASGLTDYQASGEQSPNTGLVHGVLNLAATALYVTSLIYRRKGARSKGRTYGLLGFATMTAAAYLGGELIYGQRIGVDHANRENLPGKWTPVFPAKQLEEGHLQRTQVNGVNVLLLKKGADIYAIGEVCSHLGGPLAEGKLECEGKSCNITCPWHGSTFDMQTGEVINGPATYRQPLFKTRVQNGQIEVMAEMGRPYEA